MSYCTSRFQTVRRPTREVRVGRVGVGVMVKEGAPKPDVSTVDAFKQALLTAKSVAYPDPGAGHASGIHFRAVLDRPQQHAEGIDRPQRQVHERCRQQRGPQAPHARLDSRSHDRHRGTVLRSHAVIR